MTHRYRSAIAACTLVLAGLGGASVLPSLAAGMAPRIAAADTSSSPTASQNSVSVNASGIVNVAPDMATVTVGVLVNRDNAQDAQAAANVVIAAAVRRLHALGIPNRYIQTAGISLQPRTDNSGNVIGYQATQDLAITVLNIHQVGAVVDAGVAAHANNNVSINYGLRDENGARNQALQRAVRNARARALAAASALGRSLAGAHVQLSETSAQPMPQPVQNANYSRGVASPSTPTQSQPGLLTVEEDVTLTYTF
jgi:hypothetical protein